MLCIVSCNSSIYKDEDVIILPDSLCNKLEYIKAKLLPVTHQLSVKPYFNPEDVTKVYAPGNGPVIKVNTQTGKWVEKGDTLAIMYTSATIQLKKVLLKAQSAFSIAEQNLYMAKEMRKSGHYSQIQYLKAEKEKLRAESELLSIKKELQSINKNGVEEKAKIIITAPHSGYIVENNLIEGTDITNSLFQNILSIANVKEISLFAKLDNTTAKTIISGNTMGFRSNSWPGRVCKGKTEIKKIDQQTMPQIFINFQNPISCVGRFLPQDIVLIYKDIKRKQLAIPAKSVIDEKENPYVLIRSDDNKFRKCAICITEKTDEIYYINCGLNEGDKVVVNSGILSLVADKFTIK